MTNQHLPVMLQEVIDYLPLKQGLKIFDGTFGGGGYSKAFLKNGHNLWACDLDPEVEKLLKSDSELLEYLNKTKLTFQISSYDQYIKEFKDRFFDYIVLDLGFSSNQLADQQRGFSYLNLDQALDLRYNKEKFIPAWQKIKKVNDYHYLAKKLFAYSGEKLSIKIAERLHTYVRSQSNDYVITVGDLNQIIADCLSPKMKSKTKAIMSRIWQALRIWVNDEFTVLENFLNSAIAKISPGGRLAIVSFHSLEDKLVTKFMRTCSRPKEVDSYGNKTQEFNLITKKSVLPTDSEIGLNPRSRSARLRVLEKID